MSNTDKTATVTTLATEESNEQSSRVPNFLRKPITFVKSHPKSTIAVGLGVALVTGAALTGRSKPTDDFSEPSEEAMEEARVALEEMNIPVSQEN